MAGDDECHARGSGTGVVRALPRWIRCRSRRSRQGSPLELLAPLTPSPEDQADPAAVVDGLSKATTAIPRVSFGKMPANRWSLCFDCA
jgi:hypothetical protein